MLSQTNTSKASLDINDAALVLIDHQTGLFNLVRDMDVSDLRSHVIALTRAAALANIPVVVTANAEDGPNGRLLPEFANFVPDAYFVPRNGEINAWDYYDFVRAIEKTGKKTLIMAGTLTNLGLALPAITASCCGYKVYAVVDASGASSKISRDMSVHRMMFHGVVPIDTLGMISEMMKTHSRADAENWWDVLCEVLPRYRLLVDSFIKATDVGKLITKDKGSQQQTTSRSNFDEIPRFKDSRKAQEVDTGGQYRESEQITKFGKWPR